MSDPSPCCVAHQAVVIVGGAAAPMRIAVRSPASPGQLAPAPLKATYVPMGVVYAAAAVMSSSVATTALADHRAGVLMLGHGFMVLVLPASVWVDGLEHGHASRPRRSAARRELGGSGSMPADQQRDPVRLSNGFVKRYDALVDLERAKAEQLSRVAANSGFVSPAVLAVDYNVQMITYENLTGLTPLRSFYLAYTTGAGAGSEVPELFERTGRALASVHRALVLTERIDWSPPPSFSRLFRHRTGTDAVACLAQPPQAFLHGDFGFGNVHVKDGEGEIVVLDASPNRYLTTHPSTWGSIYLDIGSMVACLRGLVGIRQFTRLRRERIAPLERAFIAGYQAVHGDLLDPRMTDAVAYAIAGTYLQFRYRVPIMGAIGLRTMFRRP